jgi:hypothetical protein
MAVLFQYLSLRARVQMTAACVRLAFAALLGVALLLAAATSTAEGRYVVSNDYSGPNFFDNFDFWSDDDPTHGYVDYVTRQQAEGTPLCPVGTVVGPFLFVLFFSGQSPNFYLKK